MPVGLRRRLGALLALCCLLAGGARAVCTAGSLKLDLLPPASTACGSSPHALCLASFRVTVATNCDIGITPLAATGNFVPGIWSTNPGATYSKLAACPTAASGPVATGGLQLPADVRAAIEQALEQHVYGPQYELAVSTDWSSGVLTLTPDADGCVLKYAVTEAPALYSTMIGSGVSEVVCSVDGILLLGTECQTNVADPCPAGTRPVSIATGKVCASCPAGSFSTSGSGCTACGAGKYAGSVTAASCTTPCSAGTYSLAGYSACKPCDAGTYQDEAGQQACDPCPYLSYARMPGAQQCVRCVAGVAKCVAGTGPDCNATLEDAPSPGYQVLSITTPSTLSTTACNLGSGLDFSNPPLFGQCTLSGATPTKLTLYVDAYCGVQMYPTGDAACSQTAESYWSSMKVKAHYVAPGRIASSLGAATSSYLMELLPGSGSVLSLSYWPVTTSVANAAAVGASSKVCAGTVDVVGGQVVGLPATPADCPPGSYNDDAIVDGCRPCPVGNVCGANAEEPTECSNDEYQPYLGQPTGSCLTCNAAEDHRLTSDAGDEYCTIPWVDTACGNGQEFDAETDACVDCPAGTSRMVGSQDVCTPCGPGQYSPAGATQCSICPRNQFSPVYGLSQRTVGNKKCLYCPIGSVAKNDDGDVGEEGSTWCDPCEAGTSSRVVAPATYNTCAPCDDGYYRSGDASSTNNVCNQIPAGYKERARGTTTYDRAQVVLCGKGEVSFWGAGPSRTPADPEACQACLGDHKYAPRAGMRACAPCPAGTVPGNSLPGLPGNDVCTACTGSTYRPASSTSSTCLECLAGREVDGSGNTGCLPCQQGHFMTDNLGGRNFTLPASSAACSACPINTYQPLEGQTGCVQCAAGTSTQDTGNIVCERCPIGYYSPNAASPCLPTPLGTFVGTTGASMYTACPLGTSSNEAASDSCNPCSPGFYANTHGSKWCKACPAGTFSRSKATSCVACQLGYYSLPGSSTCIACKPGFFANVSRSSTCKRCPIGSQCATIATKRPQPCPRGYFSNKEGNRLCTPCPANTFQAVTGQRGCLVCARGTTTRGLTGQSSCQPMRAGLRRLLQLAGN